MSTKLFVIKKNDCNQYWLCSAEHGSGWSDGHPKQSFSPSELVKEIRRLIDEKWFQDIEILELKLCDKNGPQCESPQPMVMSNRCPTCGKRI